MSWKDILKDSMARDLTADYGVDYIDRLTDDTRMSDKLVNEALATLINKRLVTKDTSVSEIKQLMLQEKDNIGADMEEQYGETIFLQEAIDRYDEDLSSLAREVHRKIQKVADRYHLAGS